MRTLRRTATFLVFFPLFAFRSVWCSGQSSRNQQREATPYKTTFRLPLSQALNGVDGYLELREDGRLTPKLSALLWGTGDVNVEDDPLLATFKSHPPRKATIQLVDQAGEILEAKGLERPLAKLRAVQMYGDSSLTYLLTVDHSVGFGSYSGPITSLIEVKGGHLGWVQATEPKTGRPVQISLMESLKTTWKLVDASDKKGKQILLAQCRPDWSSVKDNPDFTTTYARFYFDGTKWIEKKRTIKGLSEFEGGFPNRKYFP